MSPRKSKSPAALQRAGNDEQHRLEVESLEQAPFHQTTQRAPKLHEQKVKAAPLDPRSQQRRFPR
jgi:hypothetical protein